MMQELDRKNIFIYPIVNPKMNFDLYFVHHPRRPLTLAARCFVDILERKFAEVLERRKTHFSWTSASD